MNRSSATHSFILREMHELLSKRGWCQYFMATDWNGSPCYIEDRGAWNFSLVGAFFYVLDKYPKTEQHKAKALRSILIALDKRNAAEGQVKSLADLSKAREALTDEWKTRLNKYNDALGRTKVEILRLLKEAIDA